MKNFSDVKEREKEKCFGRCDLNEAIEQFSKNCQKSNLFIENRQDREMI